MADIRELEFGDLNELIELYEHLHDADDPLPPPVETERIWRELCDDPRYVYFGAYLDGHLVASCTVTVIPNLTRAARPYGLIENVVTRADLRGRGLGRAVMEAAVEICWKRDCYKVMLLSGVNRAPVHAFYERLGFDKNAKQAFIIKPPSRS